MAAIAAFFTRETQDFASLLADAIVILASDSVVTAICECAFISHVRIVLFMK